MSKFIAFLSFTAICLVCLGGWFGRLVPVAEQWPLFDALRTTAAIIFAVIGAWMAIIFPERLKLSFRPATGKISKSSRDSTGWGQLFTPVVHSTMILGVVLLLGVLYPILRHLDLPIQLEVKRGLSYAMLIALTFWQIWTVLLTLVPADQVKHSLDSADARNLSLAGVSVLGTIYKESTLKNSDGNSSSIN